MSGASFIALQSLNRANEYFSRHPDPRVRWWVAMIQLIFACIMLAGLGWIAIEVWQTPSPKVPTVEEITAEVELTEPLNQGESAMIAIYECQQGVLAHNGLRIKGRDIMLPAAERVPDGKRVMVARIHGEWVIVSMEC